MAAEPPQEPTTPVPPPYPPLDQTIQDGLPVYPQFYSPEYLVPPPPPAPRRQWPKVIGLAALVLVLVGVSSSVAYLVGKGQAGSTTSATSTPPITQHTAPTPTLNATAALGTSDFSKFLEAFAFAMGRKDYATITAATDAENFKQILLQSDAPPQDWNQVYQFLITGEEAFIINLPQQRPNDYGYECEGYSQRGIDALGISIQAAQLQYAVGSADGALPNTVVFIFELPEEPEATWLWWGVTLNNSAGCGQ